MGLGGVFSSNSVPITYSWVAIDRNGNAVAWDEESNDHHVYVVDDSWDGNYESLTSEQIIGWEIYGQKYAVGHPFYYIASTPTVTFQSGIIVTSGVSLYYGNKPVSSQAVNGTIGAVYHYYYGEGSAIHIGALARWLFDRRFNLNDIRKKISCGYLHGKLSVDMTSTLTQFHIGDTSYSYQVSGNLIFISYLINDGFWDPNFIFEKLSDKKPDKKGPRFELGGYPYDYVPYVNIYNK